MLDALVMNALVLIVGLLGRFLVRGAGKHAVPLKGGSLVSVQLRPKVGPRKERRSGVEFRV